MPCKGKHFSGGGGNTAEFFMSAICVSFLLVMGFAFFGGCSGSICSTQDGIHSWGKWENNWSLPNDAG